jgi:hypothetical protein
MKKYNLFYKTKGRLVERKNLSKEEVYDFLDSLGKEDESELRINKVEEEEEER